MCLKSAFFAPENSTLLRLLTKRLPTNEGFGEDLSQLIMRLEFKQGIDERL